MIKDSLFCGRYFETHRIYKRRNNYKMKEIKLTDISIPEDNAKKILERIMPFYEKYLLSQKIDLLFPCAGKTFNMNSLLISVYSQGLSDGIQISDKFNDSVKQKS